LVSAKNITETSIPMALQGYRRLKDTHWTSLFRDAQSKQNWFAICYTEYCISFIHRYM